MFLSNLFDVSSLSVVVIHTGLLPLVEQFKSKHALSQNCSLGESKALILHPSSRLKMLGLLELVLCWQLIEVSWLGKISILCCLTHLKSFTRHRDISDPNFGLITKFVFNQNRFTFFFQSTLNRAFSGGQLIALLCSKYAIEARRVHTLFLSVWILLTDNSVYVLGVSCVHVLQLSNNKFFFFVIGIVDC